MSKKSKKPTASKAAKSVRLVFKTGGGDDYYGSGDMFEVRAVNETVKEKKVVAPGGWKNRTFDAYAAQGRVIFRAYFGTEESCCGIPLMSDFFENEEASKHIKEIAEHLSDFLHQNLVYMQAYLPAKKGFKICARILEAAGFKAGLSLTSTHGDYQNVRWEWFPSTQALVGGKREKTVPTLAV